MALRKGSPPFAYTVGLYGFDHPELLIYGLDQYESAYVFNELGERVRHGGSLSAGQLVTVDGWPHHVHLVEFHDTGVEPVMVSAQRFYERTNANPVPALQCVWDDHRGRFPWDRGYALPLGQQPLPRASPP